MSRLLEALGAPCGSLQRYADQRGYSTLQDYYCRRGTLSSGFANQDLRMLRLRMRRIRAINRLASFGVLVLGGVTFASPFTTNRAVDGLTAALVSAGSLAAVLAVGLRRPDDEARDAIPIDTSPPPRS